MHRGSKKISSCGKFRFNIYFSPVNSEFSRLAFHKLCHFTYYIPRERFNMHRRRPSFAADVSSSDLGIT